MSAAELILDLNRLGIRLEADGEHLRFFPQSAATPEIVARLRSHKAELLAILGPPASAAPAPDINLSDAAAVWQAAVDLLAFDPLFSPEDIAAMRTAEAVWTHDDGPSTARGGVEGLGSEPPPNPKQKLLDISASIE